MSEIHTHSHTGHDHDHEHTADSDHKQEHGHLHPEEETKAILNRLSKCIGHLESIKRMIASERDCSEVLIQLSAVKGALNNTGKIILKSHIEHCIVDAVKHDDLDKINELNAAIDQFVK